MPSKKMHPTVDKQIQQFKAQVALVLTFVGFASITPTALVAQKINYKNSKLSIDLRVQDLIKRMTVAEKVAQLLSFHDPNSKIFNERLDTSKAALKLIRNGYGILQPFDIGPERDVTVKNAIQHFFIDHTRLGIPVLFADEALHGAMRLEATSFPQAIALASTWDTALVSRVNSAAAAEVRARGSQIVFSPVVDIVRDPRWGRTEETFGEDTYLSAMMGIAAVRGLQGSTNGLIDENHVAATLKHFAGHGQPEGGINQAPVDVGERSLLNFHLRTFQLIIQKATPAAIMPCYNTIDGIPAHANKWLLEDVLRHEWNYKGAAVSDWGAIGQLFTKHKTASSTSNAAEMALKAGVDLDQSTGENYRNLTEIVKHNPSLLPLIDRSVVRILHLKFQVGLFDHPYINAGKIASVCNSPQSKALAREAAGKSMVLLKNRNQLLPLNLKQIRKIAVIGPHADDMVLGGYSGIPISKTTIYQSLKTQLPNIEVVKAKGCYITTNYPENSLLAWRQDKQDTASEAENDRLIKEAAAIVRTADLTVLVVGEDEHITREHWGSAVERGGDQATMDLTPAQSKLADAILKTGKPVVVYLVNGRPLAINQINQQADAIIESWYAGQEGGDAFVDILTGKVNPSAKLPITFPKSVGQLPLYYNHQPSAQYFNYTFQDDKPLYPFGYGLSYTTFAYSKLELPLGNKLKSHELTISFELKNTGAKAGEEVVELYTKKTVAATSRPVEELKGFKKVFLKPGEAKTITFLIGKNMLEFWGINRKFETEPGNYQVMIGSSSADIKLTADIRVDK